MIYLRPYGDKVELSFKIPALIASDARGSFYKFAFFIGDFYIGYLLIIIIKII